MAIFHLSLKPSGRWCFPSLIIPFPFPSVRIWQTVLNPWPLLRHDPCLALFLARGESIQLLLKPQAFRPPAWPAPDPGAVAGVSRPLPLPALTDLVLPQLQGPDLVPLLFVGRQLPAFELPVNCHFAGIEPFPTLGATVDATARMDPVLLITPIVLCVGRFHGRRWGRQLHPPLQNGPHPGHLPNQSLQAVLGTERANLSLCWKRCFSPLPSCRSLCSPTDQKAVSTHSERVGMCRPRRGTATLKCGRDALRYFSWNLTIQGTIEQPIQSSSSPHLKPIPLAFQETGRGPESGFGNKGRQFLLASRFLSAGLAHLWDSHVRCSHPWSQR